jgi:hypothetical protein
MATRKMVGDRRGVSVAAILLVSTCLAAAMVSSAAQAKTDELAMTFPVPVLDGASSSQSDGPRDWVEQSVSQDAASAAVAQTHLRDAGPSGLLMLQQRYARQIAAHQSGAPPDEQWKRIAAALDKVGGQHDDYASGLYWYTDLEKAKAAARAAGRPILSLRLLGRLDEDLSCANSRFFRTTLYPSAEINGILKDRYILHWESVRPAPRVTIDFGDGRKLERTITGNSIHYILDPDGNVVDALPGLYSATVFAAELAAAAAMESGDSAAHLTAARISATRRRLLNAWAADLVQLSIKLPGGRPWSESDLEQRTGDATWLRMAQMHEAETTYDARARELMVRKFPSAETAAPIAASKQIAETPMLRRLANLNRTVSLDTVQNNYMRRTKILAFLAGQTKESRLSLTAVNNWVYSQVFLTPPDDPWLGLAPPDVFSAIEADGRSR